MNTQYNDVAECVYANASAVLVRAYKDAKRSAAWWRERDCAHAQLDEDRARCYMFALRTVAAEAGRSLLDCKGRKRLAARRAERAAEQCEDKGDLYGAVRLYELALELRPFGNQDDAWRTTLSCQSGKHGLDCLSDKVQWCAMCIALGD
jgi:hypothetical protein